MTETTYAEALQVTADEEPVSYLDSADRTLEVGDLVRVSSALARKTWHSEDLEYRSDRPFDFGTVDGLNADGTVEISWYSAGCSCNGTRKEEPKDLTKSTHAEYEVYELAHTLGYEKGEENTKQELREFLGIPDPSEDNDN